MKKIKHEGFCANRLHPLADNPREVTFAKLWNEENESSLLSKLIPEMTQRDATVAATVVQWLGSNVGMSFLRNAVIRDAQIREWLK
jgi:hypothetical protein